MSAQKQPMGKYQLIVGFRCKVAFPGTYKPVVAVAPSQVTALAEDTQGIVLQQVVPEFNIKCSNNATLSASRR